MKVAPAASGNRQSPIDLDSSKAEFDPSLQANPFKIEYATPNSRKLLNNGAQFQVVIDGQGSRKSLNTKLNGHGVKSARWPAWLQVRIESGAQLYLFYCPQAVWFSLTSLRDPQCAVSGPS